MIVGLHPLLPENGWMTVQLPNATDVVVSLS